MRKPRKYDIYYRRLGEVYDEAAAIDSLQRKDYQNDYDVAVHYCTLYKLYKIIFRNHVTDFLKDKLTEVAKNGINPSAKFTEVYNLTIIT